MFGLKIPERKPARTSERKPDSSSQKRQRGSQGTEMIAKEPAKTPGRRGRPIVLVAMVVVAAMFFGLTSPQSVPPTLLIAAFVMLGGLLYGVLRLILLATGLESRLSPIYRRGLMLTGTVLPVLLLTMQSIGQLTVRDVLTLTGLFLIGVFYVSRAWRAN